MVDKKLKILSTAGFFVCTGCALCYLQYDFSRIFHVPVSLRLILVGVSHVLAVSFIGHLTVRGQDKTASTRM